MTRRVWSLLAVVMAALALVVLPASPAAAHAALLESSPADGVVLQAAPTEVVLRFNQPVGTALGGVRVLDPSGARVDDGSPELRDGGRQVVVGLPRAGATGTYSLLWRVMSKDSHPVSGGSTFSVGAPSAAVGGDEAGGGGAAKSLLTASRLVGFVGVLLGTGALVLLLLVWPAGWAHPRVRRLLVAAGALVAAGTVGGLLLQGPYAAGLPLGQAVALLPEVVPTRYGTAHVVRLVLLAAVTCVVLALARRRSRANAWALLAAGLPLLATWPLAGHAGAGSLAPLSLPVDALHLLAVGTWVGGLVVLCAVLLRSDTEFEPALRRWSTVAKAAVVTMVVTGSFATWREVRSLDALLGTTYGRLLIAKVLVVLVMLYLADKGRAFVRRHYGLTVAHAATVDTVPVPAAVPTPERVAALRRSVWAEAALAAVVVVLTTFLVQTPPAAVAYSKPLSTVTAVREGLTVQVDLDSARVGPNTLHVYLTGAGGKAFDVPEVRGRLTRPGGDVLPLVIPRIDLGHYEMTQRLVVPYRGVWQLEITVRSSDVDSDTVRQDVTFR